MLLDKVYGYRMSLWAEHLETLDECFQEPSSLECIRRVNEIATNNWLAYVAKEHFQMRGHLMQYPVQVSSDGGKVTPLPNFETFPDVGGKINGAPTSLPDTLTT